MKNESQVFKNEEFGEIRAIEVNGEGWPLKRRFH